MVTMRINGFSGMDVDSMVKSMMTARKIPLDKLNQKKDLLQWQRDSYREMNSKIYDFRNKIQTKYRISSEMNTQTAVVTGNTTAVRAEATATANGVPMKVSVTQLATAATVETSGLGFGFNTKQSLAEIAKGLKYPADGSLVTDAEKAEEYTIRLNDKKTMTFVGSDSLASVIAKINANTDLNVTASFDEISGKLQLKSKDMGAASSLTLSTTPDDPTDTREVNSLFSKVFGTDPTKIVPTTGQNAKVFINDVEIDPPPTSNTVTYNGVQMTFLTVTGDLDSSTKKPDANDKPFTITTQSDPQKALDTIKSFITDYNDLMALFNKKVGEEKYRDFAPLTSDQRKELSESDIKAWEEKAKSGLMKGDDILSSTIQSMRFTVSEQLGRLSSIGITTGLYYEGGKLKLDETKLKTVLQDNPQEVLDIFQGTGSEASQSLFGKLSSAADQAMDKLAERAGTSKFSGDQSSIYKEESVMGRQLRDYNKQITVMQRRLAEMENRYYKQFTAMEIAMNKFNNQTSSLLSSLGQTS